MKYIKILYITLALCLSWELRGQAADGVPGDFNYSVSTIDMAGADQMLEIRIPKSQFESPLLFTMTMKSKQDSVVFEKVVEQALLSAARHDEENVFDLDKDDFILRVKGVPARKYKINFQVIQSDGAVFIKSEEENLWIREEGGKP